MLRVHSRLHGLALALDSHPRFHVLKPRGVTKPSTAVRGGLQTRREHGRGTTAAARVSAGGSTQLGTLPPAAGVPPVMGTVGSGQAVTA